MRTDRVSQYHQNQLLVFYLSHMMLKKATLGNNVAFLL